MSVRRSFTWASVPFLHRLNAVLGIALLLLLTTAAACPALHHWLHAESETDAGDNCAIVLFASGIVLAAATVAVTAPHSVWREQALGTVAEIFLASPRYLRQPERGPPAC